MNKKTPKEPLKNYKLILSGFEKNGQYYEVSLGIISDQNWDSIHKNMYEYSKWYSEIDQNNPKIMREKYLLGSSFTYFGEINLAFHRYKVETWDANLIAQPL